MILSTLEELKRIDNLKTKKEIKEALGNLIAAIENQLDREAEDTYKQHRFDPDIEWDRRKDWEDIHGDAHWRFPERRGPWGQF